MNKPKDQFGLAAELKRLRDYRDELKTLKEEADAECRRVEHELAQMMLDSGNDNFSLNGYKFAVKISNKFSCPVDEYEDLIEMLGSYGYERADVVTETIPWQKLNSIMDSIYEENGDAMPEEFDGVVSLFKQTGISLRKESGKNGKSKAGKSFKRREHN